MILDGKKTSEELYNSLKERISKFSTSPSLVAIQVGDNPASSTYLRLKEKKLNELGLGFEVVKFEESVSFEVLKNKILNLNEDSSVNGILVQLPLPDSLNSRDILNLVSPSKDVDCLTTENIGKFYSGEGDLMPATPLGVIRLLEFNNIEIEGKSFCIIGRSNLVGKPLAFALVQKDATVTICHSKTQNLKLITQNSDIVISAVGKAKFLTREYFKKGQIVIDVGTSAGDEGKLSGDVDFTEVEGIVEAITPVPGGVGPMTIYGLIENLIKLSELSS